MKKIFALIFFCIALQALAAPNKYVELEITGYVNEKHALYEFIKPSFQTMKKYVDIFEKARSDADVAGMILKISDPEIGWAKIDQFRRAIHNFRKDGKKVYAIIDGESMPAYLIACACNEIYMPPSGALMITGLRAEAYYLKDLLDKIGLEADVIPIGRYKNYAESFTNNAMSESTREMLNSLIDDYYSQFVSAIVKDRGLTTDTVRALIDEGPYTAKEAAAKGLVNGLMYDDELYDKIESGMTRYIDVVKDYGEGKAKMPEINFFTLFFNQPPQKQQSSGKTKFAYILASGNIVPGRRIDYPFQEDIIAADDLIDDIYECADDKEIDAIILRIDSPGGSAIASDLIWRALRSAGDEKPVIASMSDVAGSGGFYIAMGADKVVAEPGTLTGSIGVISGKLVVKNLMQKIGVKPEAVSRGKNSGLDSPIESYSESQHAIIRKLSLAVYDDFTSKVAASREMSRDAVESAAQGRVWTGRQALRLGLVDELGGIEEAMRLAREMANIPLNRPVDIVEYPKQLGLIEFIQEMFGGGTFSQMNALKVNALLLQIPDPVIRGAIPLIYMMRRESTLALMPFAIDVR